MSAMTKELFRDFFGVPVVLRDFLYRFDILIREGLEDGGYTYEVFQKEVLIDKVTTLAQAKLIVWTRCQAALEVSPNADGTATTQVASTLPAPPPIVDVNLDPEIEVADPIEVDMAYKAEEVVMAGAEERINPYAEEIHTEAYREKLEKMYP